MVELRDPAEAGDAFDLLSKSPGHPEPYERVDPARRETVRAALEKHGLSGRDFAQTETWALALMLAQAATSEATSDYGIDRAVIAAAGDKPIIELEGGKAQLAIFDALPEAEQADLLEAIAAESLRPESKRVDLAGAWRDGNIEVVAEGMASGMLADPELREALLVSRNSAWVERILAELRKARKPFVAVGTAHLVGPDGLPAMLRAQGFEVRRLQ